MYSPTSHPGLFDEISSTREFPGQAAAEDAVADSFEICMHASPRRCSSAHIVACLDMVVQGAAMGRALARREAVVEALLRKNVPRVVVRWFDVVLAVDPPERSPGF